MTDGSIRLFLAGWASMTHYLGCEDGYLRWSIDSERGEPPYTVDYELGSGIVRCTCRAGQHSVPCKHFVFLKLKRSITVPA